MKGINRKEFVNSISLLIKNHEYIFGAVSLGKVEEEGFLICVKDYLTQNTLFMDECTFKSRSDALHEFGLMWDDALEQTSLVN